MAIALSLLLSLLCGSGSAQEIQPIRLTTADQTTECENAIRIDLSNESQNCTITQPGCYVLSGEMEGGIRIDAEEQIVHLVLDGVYVDASYGPAIEIASAGKVILTLTDGSENTLRDSGRYPAAKDPDACLYSMCDLTINGSGVLNVYGFFKDAIHTKDYLKVLGGEVFVQSKRYGLHGNDGIVLHDTDFTVQSEGSGVCSTKSGDAPKGNVEILRSHGSIIAGGYGVACAADLSILESELYVKGILGHILTEGTEMIAEGSLLNE